MTPDIPPLTCQLCGDVFPPYPTPCPCNEDG